MKIGVALGGGAARGYAHIGVLKALEHRGIRPDYVAGCSMGALIGAIYCTGISIDMLEELAITITPKYWLDPSLSRTGLLQGKKLESVIATLTGNRKMEDLAIPFWAVATDVMAGEPYIFKSGSIATAVRASTAIPAIFEPVYLDDRILVDGGFVDLIPADLVKEMGADMIIAVNVGFSSVSINPSNAAELLMLSIDTLQKQLYKYKVIDADYIIRPDVSDIKPNQFDKAQDCIKIGERAAEQALEAYNI
jgi:NTE family protein